MCTKTYLFLQFYTLNADTVRILKEAQEPIQPVTNSDVRASSTVTSVSAQAADEEFKMFAAKKKAGKRGAGIAVPVTAEPKTKGKRKAIDMDTSK